MWGSLRLAPIIEKFHSKLVYVGFAQARPKYVCEALVAVLQSK